MLRILFASAELSPLVRSGGLGDAVAGLAGALARAGHAVTVAIPAYRHLASVGQAGDVWRRHRLDTGVDVVLYDDPVLFGREGIYGPSPAEPYEDNWLRFADFSVGVVELAADFDVLHLHDAHTGAAALISPIPTVFTVHNAAHPVLGPLNDAADRLGVDGEATSLGGALEWYSSANYLKAGLVGASQAITVSPTHAAELAVEATSFGLSGVIQSLDPPLAGVLNGIDTMSWDPATDPVLPKPFSAQDTSGRAAAKKELRERFGLDPGMIFGNVGRMAVQKGLDLLDPSVDDLANEGFRLVLVGNGELDALVDSWVERHPTAVAHVPYDEDLARLVSAGIDAYLMPSLFEPCGLGQLYGMRYGAPPVARLTGGLADTVVDLDEVPDRATGLGFRSADPGSLVRTIRRAIRIHSSHPSLWADLQRRGMTTDWSWDARAREYVKVYERVVE